MKLSELYQNPQQLLEDQYPWATFAKQSYNYNANSFFYHPGRSQYFPASISATNIELLARNPYGFYAKKILNLKKPGQLVLEPSFADFGIIMHQIIADYTTGYGQVADKVTHFLELGNTHFASSKYYNFAEKIWKPKLPQIAKAFIEFDEHRRRNTHKVFSEIQGTATLKIGNKEQVITAIADRIEFTNNGDTILLDYKTGGVPTAKEVYQGIASQLLVEGIILQQGGFADLPSQFPKECLYVKIQIQPPYIRVVSFKLLQDAFIRHQKGLIELLNFFVNDSKVLYLASPDSKIAPVYDDYKYLARKI